MGHTLLTLEDEVLNVHTEGVARDEIWRRTVLPAMIWLKGLGGGSILLPHDPPSTTC